MHMNTFTRCGALALGLATSAFAADFPNKPIRFVIPFAPGGGSDILARAIGLKLGDALGQPVVIDNRPGANAVNAEEILAKSTPDGHTVLLDTTAFVLNPLFNAKLPFNTEKDFVPIIQPASVWHAVCLHPGVPAKSVTELIAAMKAAPGKYTYGSFGTGSTAHLAGELLNSLAGVSSVHVPYKGGGPALTDLIGGQISMIYGTVPLVIQQVRAGRIRAIAVTSPRKINELPNVQTVAEVLPGYEVSLWWAFLAPAGTPKAVIMKLNLELGRTLKDPGVLERLAPQGFDLVGGTPEQLGAFIKTESTKWAKVVRGANIKID